MVAMDNSFTINQNHMAQQLQRDQINGILGLLTGQSGVDANGNPTHYGNRGGGLLQTLQANNGQSLQQARQQAIQDTQGLTAAALRDFNNSILPQLTGAAEGAGASASALNALLAQNAAAGQAGQVAKLQGTQILGQENLVNQANISQQHDMNQLIATLLGQVLGQTGGGGRGSTFTDATTPSATPNFAQFFAPRPPLGGFHGPQNNNHLINGVPYK